MSKTVTIPATTKPTFSCVINGVTYSYPAGSTVNVPDNVAALIEQMQALQPKEAQEPGTIGQVWTRTSGGAAWKNLPIGSAVDDLTASPTKDDFNNLLSSLRDACVIENS